MPEELLEAKIGTGKGAISKIVEILNTFKSEKNVTNKLINKTYSDVVEIIDDLTANNIIGSQNGHIIKTAVSGKSGYTEDDILVLDELWQETKKIAKNFYDENPSITTLSAQPVNLSFSVRLRAWCLRAGSLLRRRD